MQVHLHGYQRPEPCRKRYCEYCSCGKEEIFFPEKEARYEQVIDQVIVCCNKGKIAKLNSDGFGEGKGIAAKNNDP